MYRILELEDDVHFAVSCGTYHIQLRISTETSFQPFLKFFACILTSFSKKLTLQTHLWVCSYLDRILPRRRSAVNNCQNCPSFWKQIRQLLKLQKFELIGQASLVYYLKKIIWFLSCTTFFRSFYLDEKPFISFE